MSIFPKRTLRGSIVTIHWNFNTAHLTEQAVCPLVRIGVVDPLGNTTMLLEKHLLALPAIQNEQLKAEKQALYLNKNFPLLVMADYLGGTERKEKLVEILQNIQEGRHYYFHYQLPENAPLGKYTLISEVISEGQKRLSKTAADDFFFVEHLELAATGSNENGHHANVFNPSSAPIPVKVIDYHPREPLTPDRVHAFELGPGETRNVTTVSIYAYLTYNEERELVPIHFPKKVTSIRNPYLLELHQKERNATYLFHNTNEIAHTLGTQEQSIWQLTDGILSTDELKTLNPSTYGDMISKELIKEINLNNQ